MNIRSGKRRFHLHGKYIRRLASVVKTPAAGVMNSNLTQGTDKTSITTNLIFISNSPQLFILEMGKVFMMDQSGLRS
jgi:hypothetical protein